MDFYKKIQLRKEIPEKFGSFINFSKVTKTNYGRVLRILNAPEGNTKELDELMAKFKSFNISDGIEGIIGDKDRARIRIVILTHFDHYNSFCKKHPEFDAVYITNICKGRLKRVTEKYIKLTFLLKQEYNYDEFIKEIR